MPAISRNDESGHGNKEGHGHGTFGGLIYFQKEMGVLTDSHVAVNGPTVIVNDAYRSSALET